MLIFRDVPLKRYNTFGLDYMARIMIHLKTDKEAASLFRNEILWKKPLLILGSGSNILFTGDFQGTIVKPEFSGIRIERQENKDVIISAGAGIIWDKLVEWAVNKDLYGFENLSLIPGMVGAVPVQNIGAYGAEIKDSVVKVKTISVNDGSVRFFSNEECGFTYRNSIFKSSEKGNYMVTRVYFRLSSEPSFNLDYGTLNEVVRKNGNPTLKTVRDAVINIRKSKLPDYEIIGNAGSFFKNPVIRRSHAEELKRSYPLLPSFDDPSGGIKLAAGWMIEQCGWKGMRSGDAGVHEKQALVLVNHGKADGREIFDLSEKIRKSVSDKFGIELEREVEVIGTI